jgi:peptidoglycan/LPS O-acetylase OafA/YrhL
MIKGFTRPVSNQTALDTGKRHLASLDSLRAVGLILIFAHHFVPPRYYILFGWIGLWIFFALSGFLITDSLLKMKTLAVGEYFRRFYAKRIFRILPAFAVFFSISIALYFIFPRQGFAKDWHLERYWIYLVTFTFNHYPPTGSQWFSHLWSLSLEEQFYVIWPWLVFFLPANWLKMIAPCWIIVAPALRLILPWFFGNLPTQTWLVCQADAFAIGGCIAIFRDHLPGPRQSKKLLWIMTAVVIVIGLVNYFAGASAAGSYWRTLGLPHGGEFNYQYVWCYSLINIWAAVLILCCLQRTAPAFLNFPPLVFLGRISYSAYLAHLPLLGIYRYFLRPINAFTLRGFLIFVVWFVNVILVAWLSFRFIEQPFLRIKNRLGKKREQVAAPPQSLLERQRAR